MGIRFHPVKHRLKRECRQWTSADGKDQEKSSPWSIGGAATLRSIFPLSSRRFRGLLAETKQDVLFHAASARHYRRMPKDGEGGLADQPLRGIVSMLGGAFRAIDEAAAAPEQEAIEPTRALLPQRSETRPSPCFSFFHAGSS